MKFFYSINNNNDDDIDKEKNDILNRTMENDIHRIFFEKFLPNFSERLNVNSSNDINDYEDFFSMSYNDMSFILTAGVGYSVAQVQMKKISQSNIIKN